MKPATRPDEDEHRTRIRARGRAMRRLTDEYPERFAELMREEEEILGIPRLLGPRHNRYSERVKD